MSRIEIQTYRTREFAKLAGVTVRALHHYDRLGLLKPRRTPAGYRAYSTRDLEGLEQIVALKWAVSSCCGVSCEPSTAWKHCSAIASRPSATTTMTSRDCSMCRRGARGVEKGGA
jgi:hypothetical protein